MRTLIVIIDQSTASLMSYNSDEPTELRTLEPLTTFDTIEQNVSYIIDKCNAHSDHQKLIILANPEIPIIFYTAMYDISIERCKQQELPPHIQLKLMDEQAGFIANQIKTRQEVIDNYYLKQALHIKQNLSEQVECRKVLQQSKLEELPEDGSVNKHSVLARLHQLQEDLKRIEAEIQQWQRDKLHHLDRQLHLVSTLSEQSTQMTNETALDIEALREQITDQQRCLKIAAIQVYHDNLPKIESLAELRQKPLPRHAEHTHLIPSVLELATAAPRIKGAPQHPKIWRSQVPFFGDAKPEVLATRATTVTKTDVDDSSQKSSEQTFTSC